MLSKLISRCFFRVMDEHSLRKSLKVKFSIGRCYSIRTKDTSDKSVRLLSLGNGTYGTPKSIYLAIDDTDRILFNCGEGTCKAIRENKQRLGSIISAVFVTHKSWTNISGMADLLLTTNRKELILYGPPGIEKTFVLKEDNIFHDKLKIVKKEYYEPFVNKKMSYSIACIPLCKHRTNLTENKLSQNLTEEDDIALAYIYKRDSLPPVVNKKKCFEYGAEIIPLLKNLKNGHCVTLSDGRQIESKDLLQSCPPLQFIVLECPNEDYLDSLLNSSAFVQYERNNNCNDYVNAIIHLTPSSVMQHPKYQQWIQRFPAYSKHIIMNDSFKGCYERKMHRLQKRLNVFEPQLFPLLYKIEMQPDKNLDISNEMILKPSKELCIKPENERNICEIRNSTQDYESNKFDSENEEIFNEWQKQRFSLTSIKSYAARYPEIIFLGTSSKTSSAVRNVSGILVHLSNKQCILFDCGEGTYTQLINLYGLVEGSFILEKLVAVFISHNHADHRLGLETILHERLKLSEIKKLQTLYIIASKTLRNSMYRHNNSVEFLTKNCRFIPFSDIKYGQWNDARFFKDMPTVCQLTVVPVKHCPDAHAIILTDHNGFKLVYSGDTAPCLELISAGRNCDLLIHEATHTDYNHAVAAISYHCTTSQAIDVSHHMKAKYTILTHFCKHSEMFDSLLKIEDKQIAFAFDFLRVTPETLHLLPLVTPFTLRAIYSKKYIEEEDEDETDSTFILKYK